MYRIPPAVVQLEKRPRAEAQLWCEPGNDENMSYIIFLSSLLCTTHVGRVEELKIWQNKVVGEEFAATQLKVLWKPSEAWPAGYKNISCIFEPLERARRFPVDREFSRQHRRRVEGLAR